MGGFLEKFAPMMGAFWGIPAPIVGTFLEILPKVGVKKWLFPFKMPHFLPIMGGFCVNFAPMMGAFLGGHLNQLLDKYLL